MDITTPPSERKGCLTKLVPTWPQFGALVVFGGVLMVADKCGLDLADRARADAREDMAHCLNAVDGDIREGDIVRCETYGLSRLGTNQSDEIPTED